MRRFTLADELLVHVHVLRTIIPGATKVPNRKCHEYHALFSPNHLLSLDILKYD